jgi:AcrR family transcriptional regulator
MPEEQVREHQRQRLIEAITALNFERGYAKIAISDIVARAAVSKSTFYRFYRTKDECLFDAHKRHSAALIAAIDRSCKGEARSAKELLRAGIRATLTYLCADPQAAHLLGVGILSCGPRGAERYRVMIEALASRIQGPDPLPPADSALAALLLAASTLTHTIVTPGQAERLSLESELVELFLAIGNRSSAPTPDRIGVG